MPRQYESDFAKSDKPYKPYVPPRIYEQNLIDPYLRRTTVKPRLYETGSAGAANLYSQGQRLYEQDIINAQRPNPALARAGQGRAGAGYGPILAQNPGNYDVLSGPKTGKNPSAGNGPGSGGSGNNPWGGDIAEAPIEPEPVDPSIAAQQAFITRLMSLRDETLGGYPISAKNIGQYYDTASADLADPYNDYYNKARSGAESLGLNFANDDNVKLADLAARKLQENYDLNETTDLATVEKMKALNQDSFTQMLLAAEARQMGPGLLADQIKLAQEQAMAEAAAKALGGGGGGGRGGRGGSSSSSDSDNPFSEKATQDESFFNIGMADAIANIDDPEMRAYVDSIYAGTGTNPQRALTEAQKRYELNNAFVPPPVTSSKRTVFNKTTWLRQKIAQEAAKQKNAKDKKKAAQTVDFFKQWSAGYKPQVNKRSVQTTQTTKNK